MYNMKFLIPTIAITLAIIGIGTIPTTEAIGRDQTPTGITRGGQYVAIPEHAVEVAEGVYKIGIGIDHASGKVVEGYAFTLRQSEHHAKPSGTPGTKPDKSGSSSCYAFMANGANWRLDEPWVVNPANTRGLSASYVFDTLDSSIAQWEDASDGILDNSTPRDIFSGGSITSDNLAIDTTATDGLNEVVFGEFSEPGAIAVTYVWGIFGGAPQNRQIVEWDMLFDQVDFDWTSNGQLEPYAMDFANIATHELGHAFGLTHPDASCVDETMFYAADYGETSKIDLHNGDIAGIDKLY